MEFVLSSGAFAMLIVVYALLLTAFLLTLFLRGREQPALKGDRDVDELVEARHVER